MNKLLAGAYIFFTFCPYVSPIPVPSVTQPIAFLLAITYILINKNLVLDKMLLLAFIPALGVLATSVSFIFNIGAWRSIIGYSSFTTFCMASYFIFKYRPINECVGAVKLALYVWLSFGLFQTLTGIDAAFILKTHIFEVSETRGVSALATEPSYYGLICFFIFLFLEILSIKLEDKSFKRLKLLAVFQIVLLAQSSLSLLYLVLYLSIKFLVKRKYIKYFVFAIILLFFSYNSIVNFKTTGNTPRIVELTQLILNNPVKILMIDGSINHRANHIAIAISASIENHLLPISIVKWPKIYTRYVEEFSNWIIWSPGSNRIMSGYGSLFFEIGFLAFLVVFLITYAFKYSLKGTGRSAQFMIFINLLMFSAVPLAFPPVGFLLGFLYANPARRGKLNYHDNK